MSGGCARMSPIELALSSAAIAAHGMQLRDPSFLKTDLALVREAGAGTARRISQHALDEFGSLRVR